MNPNWSRSFAGQKEILEYMDKMAKDFGLTDKIEYNKELVKMTWNQEQNRWKVELKSEEVRQIPLTEL